MDTRQKKRKSEYYKASAREDRKYKASNKWNPFMREQKMATREMRLQ